MTRKEPFSKVFVALAALAAALVVSLAPALAGAKNLTGGGLSVTSADGASGAVYRAVRIADADALPIDEVFAWESLSGLQLDSHEPLPTYDPDAPDAAAQGRALVEAVSDRVADDGDGSFAALLAGRLADEATAPGVSVAADRGTVAVEDGWWLLVAEGRRPLLAWVDGALVELGDKADTPTLVKEVKDNVTGTWSDSGTYGSGQALEYRLTVTLPLSMESYDPYWIELHDTWDARLSLDEGSVRVALVAQSGGEKDLTAVTRVSVDGTSLTARIDDLRSTPAAPGDALVLTYTMYPDAQSAPGSAGLVNEAWANFPSWDGDGETPHDRNRVYSFRASVAKSSPSGAPLAGAVFAVRDASGAWLAADGTFGAEGDRATFTTGEDGLTSSIALLAPGSYVLVELEAPDGYLLPEDPEAPFTIDATHGFDHVDLKVEASGAAEVKDVAADGGSFTLSVVDEPKTPGGSTPRTGDWTGACAVLVTLLGAGLVMIGLATRRRNTDALQ